MQSLNEIERASSIRRGRTYLSIFIGIAFVVLLVCFFISKQHMDLVPLELKEPGTYLEDINGKTL